MKVWVKLVIVGVIAFAVWFVGALGVYVLIPSFVFYNQYSKGVTADFEHEIELIRGESVDEDLSLMYVDNPEQELTILYLHGNGGRIFSIIQGLSQYGDVYSPAYPGYHESKGEPAFDNVLESALKAYDYLVDEQNISPDNIVIFGHSLGGSPATFIAKQRPETSKLIVVNTFSDIQSMCSRTVFILCAFTRDLLDTDGYARDVSIPVRHFACKDDQVIPYQEGVELYESFSASSDKRFISMKDCDHNVLDFGVIGNEL